MFIIMSIVISLIDVVINTAFYHYHFNAILIGVVRHEVKMSAGRSGFIGSIWSAEHAASCMQFLKLGGIILLLPAFNCC